MQLGPPGIGIDLGAAVEQAGVGVVVRQQPSEDVLLGGIPVGLPEGGADRQAPVGFKRRSLFWRDFTVDRKRHAADEGARAGVDTQRQRVVIFSRAVAEAELRREIAFGGEDFGELTFKATLAGHGFRQVGGEQLANLVGGVEAQRLRRCRRGERGEQQEGERLAERHPAILAAGGVARWQQEIARVAAEAPPDGREQGSPVVELDPPGAQRGTQR